MALITDRLQGCRRRSRNGICAKRMPFFFARGRYFAGAAF